MPHVLHTQIQGLPSDPDGVAALLASTGIIVSTGTAFVFRTITGPSAGIGVSNGSGVSGNPTLALQDDLLAVEDLASTGVAVRSGTSTWTVRTITAGTGIGVSNGSGVSGNPTISLSHLGIESLTDPGADRILFWDDSAGFATWLTVGSGLSISGTTITASLDITGLTAADPALGDELPIYDISATANRKITVEELGFILTGMVGGRLTLDINNAVSTSDVTGANTIYYSIYSHDKIALYDGTRWKMYMFSQRSLSLTLTSGKNYDVYLYDNAGTLTLELSAAWSTDTGRTDALTTQDGVYVKSGSTTRRYLGTIRASGSNATEDSVTKRFVWNMYNRVPRALSIFETTTNWTYGTDSWRQMNNTAANKVECVIGLAGDAVGLVATTVTVGNGANGMIAIGYDSTTARTSEIATFGSGATSSTLAVAALDHCPGVGYHYYAPLERSAGGTVTYYSRSFATAGKDQGSGMTGRVLA